MATNLKRLGGGALAGALLLAAWPALAQQNPGMPAPAPGPANPAGFNGPFLGRGGSPAPVFSPAFRAPNFGAGSPFATSLAASPLAALAPSGLASLTSVTPYSTPYASSPGLYGASPYGAVSPYGLNYQYSYADPYGGGLRGAAAAIDAQGRFEVTWQQSRLLGQEVERSMVDTRRKIYDEWLYERATRPTVEGERERSQSYEVRRILRDAPEADVASGYALNTLLKNLGSKPGSAAGPNVALDPDLFKHVNVTAEENGGNIGMLKFVTGGAGLPWPLPLQASAYNRLTRRLDQQARDAVNMARNNGKVDADTLKAMKDDVRALADTVRNNVNDLTPSQAVEARRFLSQLDDAILVLQQEHVANYFTDTWAAKGKTVADLVNFMRANGLKFAPAVGGDEAAYSALYRALVKYSGGAAVAAAPSPAEPKAPPAGKTAPAGGSNVGIFDDYFGPATTYVEPGTTVRWTNYGLHHHTVTSATGLFDSGELDHNGTFTYTFTKPGTYEYHCNVHPKVMRGTVVVK
jgi:plastocyanin